MGTPGTPELRKKWREYWKVVFLPDPRLPPLPDELDELECGAKNRRGL